MRKHILLLEIHSLRTLLLEDRVSFLKDRYLARIEDSSLLQQAPVAVRDAVLDSEGVSEAEKTFSYIMAFDPDDTKRNTQWLLNLLLKGAMRLEDLPTAMNLIREFNRVKRQLPSDQKDINRFKTPGDLALAIRPFAEQEVVSKRENDRRLEKEMLQQANVILDNSEYRVLIPLTEEASCFFGINTRWCTAARETENLFSLYNKQGPLYIILHKPTNRRWQFHFQSKQFMDEEDRQIDLIAFCDEHPLIEKLFQDVVDSNLIHIGNYRNWTLFKDRGGRIRFTLGFGLRAAGDDEGTLELNGDQLTKASLPKVPRRDKELVDLLNSLGIRRAVNPALVTLAAKSVFLNPENQKWGFIEDVTDHTIDVSGFGTWYIHEINPALIHAQFIDQNDNVRVYGLVSNFVLIAHAPDASDTRDRNCLKAVAKIVTEYKKIQLLQTYDSLLDSVFYEQHFPDDMIRYIAKRRPELLSVEALARGLGENSKSVRERLEHAFRGAFHEYVGEVFDKDKIVTEIYPSIGDISHHETTADLSWLIDELSGYSRLDEEQVEVEDADRMALLSSLSSADLKGIASFLEKEHKKRIVGKITAEAILQVHKEVGDLFLEDAFLQAKIDGTAVYAKRRARELLSDAVKNHPYFVMEDKKGWKKDYVHDGACGIAVPISELIKISSYPSKLSALGMSSSWLQYLGVPIGPHNVNDLYDSYDLPTSEKTFQELVEGFT